MVGSPCSTTKGEAGAGDKPLPGSCTGFGLLCEAVLEKRP